MRGSYGEWWTGVHFRVVMMNEYEFQLDFRLGYKQGLGEDAEQYLEALYACGCDDAVAGIGVPGYLGLEFAREGKSAVSALVSAIENVHAAIPHAKLVRAGPWLVNLSELALMFGCTKQNISKYARGEGARNKKPFPDAVVTGKTAYWYALDVVRWLDKNTGIDVSPAMLEILDGIFSLNYALDQEQVSNAKTMATFREVI